MKKTAIIVLITALALAGCTRIPRSEETGVIPGEYNQNNSQQQNQLTPLQPSEENEQLRQELSLKEKEIADIKSELKKLRDNNDEIMDKLSETEEMLKILSEAADTAFPALRVEESSRDNILSYLRDQSSKLTMQHRAIEILEPLSADTPVIFKAWGYEEGYYDLFGWKEGDNEPHVIDGASFDRDGDCRWLLQDRFIIVDTGTSSPDEVKIIDAVNLQVADVFENQSHSMYLLPGTSCLLMEREKTDSRQSSYGVYDFVTKEEQDIVTEFRDRNTGFWTDEETGRINFGGSFTDDNGVTYTMEAVLSADELIEKYGLKSLDESLAAVADEPQNDEPVDEAQPEPSDQPEGENPQSADPEEGTGTV